MTMQKYQLDNTILKTTEALTLFRTEKGIVEISKDALAIPVKLGDELGGYVFHGNGKLLLDTIVETEEGAIGKPIDKEINEPFLMLGSTEEIQPHLNATNKEDVTEMGYKNEQEFMTKAEDLLDQFLGKRSIHRHQHCGNIQGFIFAFPNKAGKLDILVAKGSKLVYKTIDTVFVSHRDKVVMKTVDEVILSHGRKLFTIKK
jgi:hypothetical protein